MKRKKLTNDELVKALINKMLEPFGVDIEYCVANHTIEGKPWYQHFTMTQKQWDEYEKWAKEMIKSNTYWNKKQIDREFAWFALNYGLSIKEEDNGITEARTNWGGSL